MAKFYGAIGYAETVETAPSVWEEQITERNYYVQNSGQVNDDVNISNEFSIIADPYANENFHTMRYIKFMGAKWKITNVDVQYPRLILTVGGVYNEQQA